MSKKSKFLVTYDVKCSDPDDVDYGVLRAVSVKFSSMDEVDRWLTAIKVQRAPLVVGKPTITFMRDVYTGRYV